jgi:23S rRNA (guanosine2251-2'-O)-methyltransferase
MKKQPANPGSRPSKYVPQHKSVSQYDEDFLFMFLAKLGHDPLLLILDCVQDPHNLGACLRSADAAGVDAVIIPKDRSVRITDTVRNIAAGGADAVPVIAVTNLARVLKQLKERNVWLVGTADQSPQSLYDIDLKGPLAVVMGAEGEGLRRLTQESCDFVVQIPMFGSVECLNVSVATGVCLFEAVRQRRALKKSD